MQNDLFISKEATSMTSQVATQNPLDAQSLVFHTVA
jgi:hypothetical protein